MDGFLGRLLRDRRRRVGGGPGSADGGMTLVEMLVAMTMITVGVLGLLGELAANLKQQHTEKLQTNAIRLATSSLESARSSSTSSLASLASLGTQPPDTVQAADGTSYSRSTTVQLCAASDGPGTCTTPATGVASTYRATVTISWTNNGSSHSVRMSRNLADVSTSTLTSGVNPLGSCGGSGTTLVSGTLALSPSSVTVDSSGRPSTSVTATLTETGLSNATCVPLTWSDDTGAHQLSMTGSNGTYSVSIPASSITKTVSTGGSSVAFTATVPGTQAVPSASLSILGQPTFSGNCTVTVNPIVLAVLTRKTALSEALACTTTNLVKTDTVTATYASGSSGNTKSISLTSSNGSNWSATLPAGSAMANTGTSEAFTFALKRASDNATASQNITETLA